MVSAATKEIARKVLAAVPEDSSWRDLMKVIEQQVAATPGASTVSVHEVLQELGLNPFKSH